MTGDPYQVLGVPQTADAEQIKQAYRRLAKQYHPDLHPGDAEAARRMNEINEAYDLIKNPAAYRQQQQQQAYRAQQQQTYYSAQTGQDFDPFDFFRAAGGQYWTQSDPNDTQQTGQNAYHWTYRSTRRPRSLFGRLLAIYLVIQLFLSLFGGCAYRLTPGSRYDVYDQTQPQTSDSASSASDPYSDFFFTQDDANRQTTGGFGHFNS